MPKEPAAARERSLESAQVGFYHRIRLQAAGSCTFARRLRSLLKKTGSKSQDIHRILREIVSFVDKEALQALHPQYAQGDYFSDTIAQLGLHLSEFRKGKEWNDALDELEGANAVPIMTIHKSKAWRITPSFSSALRTQHFGTSTRSQPRKPALFLSRSRAPKTASSSHSANIEPNRQTQPWSLPPLSGALCHPGAGGRRH